MMFCLYSVHVICSFVLKVNFKRVSGHNGVCVVTEVIGMFSGSSL